MSIYQAHVVFMNHSLQSLIQLLGVLPRSIMISLNPIINCVSNFGLLNSLFSAAWISVILAFGLSLEFLMVNVSAWSCGTLTSVAFFMLSSMTPCASHTTFTTNQNWFGSSFPTPLNTRNFIALTIWNYGGGGGGVGGDGGDAGETDDGVGGDGMHGIPYLIKLIALLGNTFMSSSSLSRRGEIKGLFSILVLPSFL